MSKEYLVTILVGLKEFVEEHADVSDIDMLTQTIEKSLNRLDVEDFFGTQGWRHYLGVDD